MDHLLPIDVADGLKLDPKGACRIGESLSSDHAFAEPFPHIVIENLPVMRYSRAVMRRVRRRMPA